MPQFQDQQDRPEVIELHADSPPHLISAARDLLLEYGRFVMSHPAAARFCFGSLEKEAADLPHSYIDHGGGCLFASLAEEPAGFVAWRNAPATLAEVAWELKRLWVRPVARGAGLGRTLALQVLRRAIAAHRNAVYLDTVPAAMPAAHRMYLDLGFHPCAPYNDNPIPDLAYLVKNL